MKSKNCGWASINVNDFDRQLLHSFESFSMGRWLQQMHFFKVKFIQQDEYNIHIIYI